MKIGLLLPGFSARSDDWAIPVQQNLARLLAARDDVRIVALRYPFTQQSYALDGAVVHPLGAGSYARGWQRLTLWQDALRLIRRLHRQQPFDVLHAMWADETGLLAAWAGRMLGVPVVVSILGGELVGLPEIDYGLQRSRFSRWVVGQALGGADRVIVPSSYVQTLLDASGYRVPPEKQVRLALGVDASRFTPPESPAPAKHLIHVGSLIPVKDQATLLKALALLEPGIMLDIIGTGAEHERLQTLARELGITERVRFVGAVAHPELPAYYQQAAVHVVSSRHDASPLTTLEAAACALPTVSTTVGTVPDYPALGVTVPVGDPPALAAAVQALLADPQTRAALGQAARALVEQELTIERTAQRLRALYAELAQQKAGA